MLQRIAMHPLDRHGGAQVRIFKERPPMLHANLRGLLLFFADR